MSSNIESTVAPVPARAVPVQRKKKTVPVITKYEELPEVAQTGAEFTYETPNVVSTGIPQTGQQSMAETLLTIIQTKPVIQTPKYKKKNVTVADVVAPKIPKQNKKKNVEPAPEPGIAQSNIDNIESLTVVEQVIAETPKVPKKRAPKKKAEVVAPEQTVVYERTGIIAQNIENIESPIETVVPENTLEVVPAKAPKKRAPKKKVEPVVVVPEQTGIVESNIDNIESLFGNMTLEEVPTVVPENTLEVVPAKAPKKRAPKKKAEVVVPEQTVVYEQTGIIESNIENIESPIEAVVPENTLEVVQTKVPKKRVSKKKAEVVIAEQTGIVESNIENIESLFGNMTLEGVPAVVPVEVPKAPKKRAPKKKTEVVIAEQTGIVESKIENIESPMESVVQENTLEMMKEDNGMEWFDEQAKEVQIRREPILATFAQTSQELVEEIYEATTNQNNPIEKEDSTPYGNLQPIADIIADTLENDEDDYSEQIMVETFEFNGQLYWIDAENRVLDKNTFQHIGQYDDSIAAISFYANANAL